MSLIFQIGQGLPERILVYGRITKKPTESLKKIVYSNKNPLYIPHVVDQKKIMREIEILVEVFEKKENALKVLGNFNFVGIKKDKRHILL